MTDDLEELLRPASVEHAVGPDLEYDPQYAELLQLCEGEASQQMGESVRQGQPPQPEEALALAEALLRRSKDLRLAIRWQLLRFQLEGPFGYLRGLQLLRGLMERYGAEVHPLPEPDDPTHLVRANALAAGLMPAVLRKLEQQALAAPPDAALIALARAALDDIAAVRRGFLAACSPAAAATAASATAEGMALGPDFEPLQRVLQRLAPAPRRTVEDRAAPGESGPASAAEPGGLERAAPGWQIESRPDVSAALEAIRSYYARREPCSPVPLLLARAERLVEASFAEAVRELLPAAAGQLDSLSGEPE